MATTLTVTSPYGDGGISIVRARAENIFFLPFTFVPVAAYDTSGNAIATADMPVGYKDLLSVWAAFGGGPYGFKLDVANKKLLAYGAASTATAVELAANTNLQTVLGTAAITIWFVCR